MNSGHESSKTEGAYSIRQNPVTSEIWSPVLSETHTEPLTVSVLPSLPLFGSWGIKFPNKGHFCLLALFRKSDACRSNLAIWIPIRQRAREKEREGEEERENWFVGTYPSFCRTRHPCQFSLHGSRIQQCNWGMKVKKKILKRQNTGKKFTCEFVLLYHSTQKLQKGAWGYRKNNLKLICFMCTGTLRLWRREYWRGPNSKQTKTFLKASFPPLDMGHDWTVIY